jgi:hypothetical protein
MLLYLRSGKQVHSGRKLMLKQQSIRAAQEDAVWCVKQARLCCTNIFYLHPK